MMGKKLVYGVGFNDADYAVCPLVNGKQVMCTFYMVWKSMLERCYSTKLQAKRPTYIGCTVCEEWLTFSNFKKWMEQQDWRGKEPDKDILFVGNKIYKPETCVFVDSMTNTFTTDSRSTRGDWPIGVSFHKRREKLEANCNNPFTGKKEFIGYFACPNEAHLAWRKRKHELSLQLANMQTDERVAAALRIRYIRQEKQ